MSHRHHHYYDEERSDWQCLECDTVTDYCTETLPEDDTMTPTQVRLEYLRGEIRAEQISMGELIELQGMANLIDRDDIELLEWAGVPEFPEDTELEGSWQTW